MFRRVLCLALLTLASASAFAASPTTITTTTNSATVGLRAGDNVVNFVLPSSSSSATAAPATVAVAVDTATPAVTPVSAPRATCSAYRAQNPTSALTRAYCAQAAGKSG